MPDIAEAAAAPDPRDPLGSADGERTATAASAAHDSAAAGAAAPPELATAVPGGTAERTGDAGANAPSYGPQGAAATGTTAVTPDKLKSHLEQLRSHLEQLRSHMPRAPEDAQGTHKHTNTQTRARAHTHTHTHSLSLSLFLSHEKIWIYMCVCARAYQGVLRGAAAGSKAQASVELDAVAEVGELGKEREHRHEDERRVPGDQTGGRDSESLASEGLTIEARMSGKHSDRSYKTSEPSVPSVGDKERRTVSTASLPLERAARYTLPSDCQWEPGHTMGVSADAGLGLKCRAPLPNTACDAKKGAAGGCDPPMTNPAPSCVRPRCVRVSVRVFVRVSVRVSLRAHMCWRQYGRPRQSSRATGIARLCCQEESCCLQVCRKRCQFEEVGQR